MRADLYAATFGTIPGPYSMRIDQYAAGVARTLRYSTTLTDEQVAELVGESDLLESVRHRRNGWVTADVPLGLDRDHAARYLLREARK